MSGRTALAFAVASSVATLALSASAHISLEQGGTHKSRYGDAFLKDGPCGKAGGTRGTNVYTYAAGQTITLSVVETIPHPSYFRIAFDDDGDDGFQEPASIEPIDPKRPCPFNAADKCGASDFYDNDTVLPGMDDLNPHIPTSFTTAKYTWSVKLPNVECDNCTLQIIQVMEDTIHGAYNPHPGDPNDNPYIEDIYHQCIDLVLTRGDSGTDGGATAAVGRTGSDSGGCSVSRGRRTGRDAAWLAPLLGAWAVVRRRRPRR
jgi:hypothetical protein